RPASPRGEGEQRNAAAGRNSGTEPPELTIDQRRGFASGQLRRQSEAWGDSEGRESGQAPKEPLPPTDLAAAQRQSGPQQEGKPDPCQDVRKEGVGGALDAVLRFPRSGMLVRRRHRGL